MEARELELPLIGRRFPLERISSPWRREDDGIIAAIIRSFDQRVPLSVRYQSLTTKEGKRRTICPHHLVDNSNRLHARTWDYERNAFIDLVLTTMVRTPS